MMQTQRPIKRALLSVSDKTGLIEFAHELIRCNIELLATGGTAKQLQAANIPIIEISDYTGFPEIMSGRVKTLHPKIHGGLLGRRGVDDETMTEHGIQPIDLLVVNLYPFAKTIADPNCTLSQAIEQIDIGGPTMLRAAAKNFNAVTTVVDPADYANLVNELNQHNGETTQALRQTLAQKVFAHTAQYDQRIATYLAEQSTPDSSIFPAHFQPQFERAEVLRYGENPHQQAAFYRETHSVSGTLGAAALLQGKPLSYNNMIDADCALQCVQALNPKQSACIIVKHATPCGAAEASTTLTAYNKAFACDPQSAFGGIIAFNQPVNADTAEKIISQQFVEVLLAPAIDADALRAFSKKPNLRILTFDQPSTQQPTALTLHSVSGGLLVQQQDILPVTIDDLTIVTKRQPSEAELKDLLFAWHVVKYIKSNAIVYAKDQATLGIGTGQTSRVFAAEIAALRAQKENLPLENAALASDAFFPFADGVEVAAEYGIRSIIQPGGSKRDSEVIAAADKLNIAMVFTGNRHFRH